jgi:hypothetical protein
MYSASTCEGAAAGGHQHVLQFLRAQGYEWDDAACHTAVIRGDLTTLKWLHEQGCPWDARFISDDAAATGSIEMLAYLKQEGCHLRDYTMKIAAEKGHLAVCQYLRAEQCPVDTLSCAAAAQNGHLEIVRFLNESGCPWDIYTLSVRAAENADLELLEYLKQEGCVFDTGTMSGASSSGHTHICQYLRAQQCPWDTGACFNAARGGSLSTLRWLHEQGCPWNVNEVRLGAAGCGHIAMLEFMLQFEPAASAAQLTEMLSRVSWSIQSYTCSSSPFFLAAAKWLRQHGAEWPAVLKYHGCQWKDPMLQWARLEGCTSPTS